MSNRSSCYVRIYSYSVCQTYPCVQCIIYEMYCKAVVIAHRSHKLVVGPSARLLWHMGLTIDRFTDYVNSRVVILDLELSSFRLESKFNGDKSCIMT